MGHSRTFLLRGQGTGVTTSATGTANTIPKFTAASTIADSTITDTGSLVTINSATADVDVRIASDTNGFNFVSDAGAFSGVGAIGLGGTPSAAAYLTVNPPAFTGPAGQTVTRTYLSSANALTIGAGTSGIAATLYIEEPNLTLGGNAVSDAYTVFIGSAPTEGTRNGALWVGAGTSRFDGDISLTTAGNGFFVKEGSNATMGVVTLSGAGGSAIVYTTKLTAASRIFITEQNSGGTPGVVRVTSSTNLVSFTITSSSITDTSVVAWWLVQQA